MQFAILFSILHVISFLLNRDWRSINLIMNFISEKKETDVLFHEISWRCFSPSQISACVTRLCVMLFLKIRHPFTQVTISHFFIKTKYILANFRVENIFVLFISQICFILCQTCWPNLDPNLTPLPNYCGYVISGHT